jgi:hypothetical protein
MGFIVKKTTKRKEPAERLKDLNEEFLNHSLGQMTFDDFSLECLVREKNPPKRLGILVELIKENMFKRGERYCYFAKVVFHDGSFEKVPIFLLDKV